MKCAYSSDSIVSGNKRLHLDIYTAGSKEPVILFISGLGCYAGINSDFMKELSNQGFTVIGIDLPGHGRSAGPRGKFTFREAMEAVSDVVSYAISRFNDRIGLMGSSLGGTFALYGAMHDPRLKAVLCHNAMDISSDLHVAARFPELVRFLLSHKKLLAGLFPWFPVPLRVLIDWNEVAENKELLRTLYHDPLMVWFYSLGTWASFIDYAPEADLGKIETPVKIVVGSQDRLFTPEHCRSLSRKIGKDGACFEMIPGGHGLTLEHIPESAMVAAKWFRENL